MREDSQHQTYCVSLQHPKQHTRLCLERKTRRLETQPSRSRHEYHGHTTNDREVKSTCILEPPKISKVEGRFIGPILGDKILASGTLQEGNFGQGKSRTNLPHKKRNSEQPTFSHTRKQSMDSRATEGHQIYLYGKGTIAQIRPNLQLKAPTCGVKP